MLGGEGKVVEFDETFVGGKNKNRPLEPVAAPVKKLCSPLSSVVARFAPITFPTSPQRRCGQFRTLIAEASAP